MRGTKVFIIFLACIGLGIFIGYIAVEKEKEVFDTYYKIKSVFKKEKLEIVEGLNSGNLEVVTEERDGDYYHVAVEEDFHDINAHIKGKMLPYYVIMASALEKEGKSRKGKDAVRLVVGNGEQYIGMELSREKYNGMEKSMGEEFLHNHLSTRGWDLLNNVDVFWMSDNLKEGLRDTTAERINWDLEREK